MKFHVFNALVFETEYILKCDTISLWKLMAETKQGLNFCSQDSQIYLNLTFPWKILFAKLTINFFFKTEKYQNSKYS